MEPPASFEALLSRQSRALGRHQKPAKIFRQTIRRLIGGRLSSGMVRRISPPDRIRDDVSVDGAWRFSEAFDGTRAWFLDKNHPDPTEATGLALAVHRWAGTRLDHMQPLKHLTRRGCTLRDCGLQSTVRGHLLPAVQVSMLDYFTETVFIDEAGRIAAHHLDLPAAGDEEREMEVCVDEWGQHDGLVHPVRSIVIDRNTGGTVAEIIVTDVCLEAYAPGVFNLTTN